MRDWFWLWLWLDGVDMSPSPADGPPTLDSLPAELQHRIATFLLPSLSTPTGSASPHSSQWTAPSSDLIQLSSCSRALWLAVRSLVGREFGARAAKSLGGLDLAHRLESVSGDASVGVDGMPDVISGAAPRAWSVEEREQREAVAREREWPHLVSQPQFYVRE